MTAAAPAVPGYRGPRGEILVALKKAQPLTVKELALQFGVTPNGLRRYLKGLEEEGVVRYAREVRGVGGPVFAYSLSEAGEALFPQAYRSVLADALEVVRETQGAHGVMAVFRRHWAAIATAAKSQMATLPVRERALLLSRLLTAEGYMAEVSEGGDDETTLREHHCPVRGIAEQYPEVCEAEAKFIEDVLGADVTRRRHIVSGCNACEYTVQAPDVRITALARDAALAQGEKA